MKSSAFVRTVSVSLIAFFGKLDAGDIGIARLSPHVRRTHQTLDIDLTRQRAPLQCMRIASEPV